MGRIVGRGVIGVLVGVFGGRGVGVLVGLGVFVGFVGDGIGVLLGSGVSVLAGPDVFVAN